jgi:hypothetical protein
MAPLQAPGRINYYLQEPYARCFPGDQDIAQSRGGEVHDGADGAGLDGVVECGA